MGLWGPLEATEARFKISKPTAFQQLKDITAIRKFMSLKKGTKRYCYVLNDVAACLVFQHKWEECMLAKLRCFEYIIIYDILATNSRLNCPKATYAHFVNERWRRYYTLSVLWMRMVLPVTLLRLLYEKGIHVRNMKLDPQLILFGFKKTQILIASLIVNIISNIFYIKKQYQKHSQLQAFYINILCTTDILLKKKKQIIQWKQARIIL